MTERIRSYVLALCAAEGSNAWKLTLFLNGHEVTSRTFPAPVERRDVQKDWWDKPNRRQKPYWITGSGRYSPSKEVRLSYLLTVAHAQAIKHGNSWVNSIGVRSWCWE